MLQRATVESVNGKYATVTVSRKGMCDGCHQMSCGEGCPMSSLVASGGRMSADAVNGIGAAPGDVVQVEAPDGRVLGTAAFVFLMPIAVAIGAYLTALAFSATEIVGAVAAVAGFLVSLVILGIVNGAIKKKGPTLRIVKIIEKGGTPAVQVE